MPTGLLDVCPEGSSVLLVSPHLDDAALSCEAVVGGRTRVDVLTVFAGRPQMAASYPWDAYCGFDNSNEAMDTRLAEDDAAFADTPHGLHRLGMCDAQYLTGPRPAVDEAELCSWVDAWMAEQKRAIVVLLPVGTGLLPSRHFRLVKRILGVSGRAWLRRWRQRQDPRRFGPVTNPDHLWVRDVLSSHLASRNVAVTYYEEFPYLLARRGDVEAAQAAVRLDRRVQKIEVRIDPAAKGRRIECYASQSRNLVGLGKQFAADGGTPSVERYWRLMPGTESTGTE